MHSDSARIDSAIYYFQWAAKGFTLQHNDSAYALCLNQIGRHYCWQGQYDRARQILHQSIMYSKAKVGSENEPLAQAYGFLGQVVSPFGKVAEADSLFRLSYQIRRRIFGDNHPLTAESIHYTGYSHLANGENNYQLALQAEQKVLPIRLQHLGRHHLDVGLSYLALGHIHNKRTEYGLALEMLEKCETIFRKKLHNAHIHVGQLQLEKGIAQLQLGQFKEASRLLETALLIFRKQAGENSHWVGMAYGQLGTNKCREGDSERGIVYFGRELDIEQKLRGKNDSKIAGIYSKLGFAYGQMGNNKKYLENCKMAFAIILSQQPGENAAVAHSCFMLAAAYQRNALYSEALAHYQRAKNIFTRTFGEIHPMVSHCLQGMARIHKRQHNYPVSLQYYEQALQILRRQFGVHYPESAYIYKMMGDIRQLQQLSDSALAYYQQALFTLFPTYSPDSSHQLPDLEEATHHQTLIYNLLDVKAQLFKDRYLADASCTTDLVAAFRHLDGAVGLIDKIRVGFQGEEGRMLLSEHTRFVYQHAIELAYLLFEQTREKIYAEKAFYFAEKGKASVLLDVTRKVSARQNAGIPPELLQREENLKQEVAQLEKKIQDEQRKDSLADQLFLQKQSLEIARVKNAYWQLMDTLERTYPKYYQLKYNTRVAPVTQIRQQLRPGQALVSYFLADSLLYIFVVSPQRFSIRQVSHGGKLESQVRAFRSALLGRKQKEYTRQAFALYQLLLAPIQPQLSGVHSLYLIPEGITGYISFETLLTASVPEGTPYHQLPYLLKQFQLTYDHSGTFFVQHSEQPATRNGQSVLAFAPDFAVSSPHFRQKTKLTTPVKNNSRELLTPLPGARREAERIVKLSRGKCLKDGEATEGQFKTQAEQYSILHLATHALTDDRNPDHSRLVFAEDKAGEDGFLYAYELYNLKLNAELVVLSACNTGTGMIRKGEGIMSLARGFAYAGCPNIVMSLWPASDQASADIMENFYRKLKKGLTKEEALHQAKLQYLQNADPLSANPYFWGSFVLLGNTHPVSFPSRLLPHLGIVLLILLIGAAIIYQRQVRGRVKISRTEPD